MLAPARRAAVLSVWIACSAASGIHAQQENQVTPVSTESFDMKSASSGHLNFYIRLPAGLPPGENAKGVIVFCKFADTDIPSDISSPMSNFGFLVQLGDELGYAIVAFGQPVQNAWDKRLEEEDQRASQARYMEKKMDDAAAEWSKLMSKVARKYKLADKGYLIYGFCAGAQFAHRLALREPSLFKAVHADYGGSYGTPTPAGKSIYWLVTTWEDDVGNVPSQKFCAEARALNYHILQRAFPRDQGTSIHNLGTAFFRYAAGLPDLDHIPTAYIGDIMTYIAWPPGQAGWIPRSQTVELPNRQIAELWGQVRE